MKKQHVRLAVVMPLGPNDHPTDTIASIRAYTTNSRVLVVIDDTKNEATAKKLRHLGDDVHVLKAGDYPGGWGGLFVKLAQGFNFLLEHYTFETLLRIDADALVIGKQPEDAAIDFFQSHPSVGIAGSYQLDCNGNERDLAPPAKELRYETSPFAIVTMPAVRRTLRPALKKARNHDYVNAEHCLGGAYFVNPACAAALLTTGWLDQTTLARSRLGEDHLFALGCRAAGFELGDLATGQHPLGVSWQGLPDSPAALVSRGKKIIHSVRFWQNLDEAAIRGFFAQIREKGMHE